MENKSLGKAIFAEVFGTFALVFVIIVVVAMYALQADIARGLTYPFIAFAHGFILFLLIQTLGSVSGAHFNPAVTLGVLSIRQIKASHAGAYIVAQVVGAILAALLAKVVIDDQASTVKFAATSVSNEINAGKALVLEAVFAFFLVWTVIGTAVDPRGAAAWAPLAIAGSLTMGVLLIAPLTGASINPARSIGPALVSGEWGATGDFLMAYVIGPIGGGLLAALLYGGLFLTSTKPAEPAEPSAAAAEPPL